MRRRAVLTVVLGFVSFGLFWGTLAGVYADLKLAFDLSPGTFGLLLATFPVAGCPVAVLSGRYADRLGPRALVAVGGVASVVGGVLLLVAPGIPVLVLGALLAGGGSGALDVGINVQAVRYERASGRHILGRLHGTFFAGAGAGGGIASLAHVVDAPWRAAPASAFVVVVAASALAWRILDGPAAVPATGRVPTVGIVRTLRVPGVLLLTGLVLIGFSLDGGIGSWAGVHLRETLGAAPAVGSLVVGINYVMVALGSSSADWLAARVGPARTAATGGVLATAGLGAAAAAPGPLVAGMGFGVACFGFASLGPMAFSEAGRRYGDRSTAVVSSLMAVGYVAFLAGPPAFGAVAGGLGLRVAFALLAGLGLVAILVSRAYAGGVPLPASRSR